MSHALSPTSGLHVKLSQIKSDRAAISPGRFQLSFSGGIFRSSQIKASFLNSFLETNGKAGGRAEGLLRPDGFFCTARGVVGLQPSPRPCSQDLNPALPPRQRRGVSVQKSPGS